jgi:hypothetical protein
MHSALFNATTESDDDDADDDDATDLNCLPFAGKTRELTSEYPSVDYLRQEVCELVSAFRTSILGTVSSPLMAMELWTIKMKSVGVYVPVDLVGLNDTGGNSLTVRPPLEDVSFFKHVNSNRIVMAYGPKKSEMKTNKNWLPVDRVLTVGLGSDDDVKDFDVDDEPQVDRLVPLTVSEINACIPSFSTFEAIIEFFTYGDEKTAKPCEWKSHPKWPTFQSALNFNQHYTDLCAQFIYARISRLRSVYLLKKKDRVATGRRLYKSAQAALSKKERVNIVRYAISML